MTDLSRVWAETAENLPDGWSLDGLRCASTSLRPEDRSDDWVAVATGPAGEQRQFQAADPIAALQGLGKSFSSTGQSVTRRTEAR